MAAASPCLLLRGHVVSVTVTIHPGSRCHSLLCPSPEQCPHEASPILLGTVDRGAHHGSGPQRELSRHYTSGEGIAQVMLSGTSAGMTGQIASCNGARGLPAYEKWSPSVLLEVPPPLCCGCLLAISRARFPLHLVSVLV